MNSAFNLSSCIIAREKKRSYWGCYTVPMITSNVQDLYYNLFCDAHIWSSFETIFGSCLINSIFFIQNGRDMPAIRRCIMELSTSVSTWKRHWIMRWRSRWMTSWLQSGNQISCSRALFKTPPSTRTFWGDPSVGSSPQLPTVRVAKSSGSRTLTSPPLRHCSAKVICPLLYNL